MDPHSSVCPGRRAGFPSPCLPSPSRKTPAQEAETFRRCFRLALPRLLRPRCRHGATLGYLGLPWATLGYFGLPGHFGQGGKVSAPSRLPPARIKPFLTGEGRGRLQGRGFPLVSVCVLGSGDRLLAKGGVSPFDEDITRSALPILRHREPGSP